MKLIGIAIYGCLAVLGSAQETFSVTGTRIPQDLAQANYGKLPSSVQGFDLNVCNQSAEKHAVTGSQIYQALAEANPGLQPLGRRIMLGAILRSQRRSLPAVLAVVLNSAVGVLSVLGASRTGVSGDVLAGAAVGAAVSQQLVNNLKPVLSADQMERYESQVLESALVLDGGSCAERTVFALSTLGPKSPVQSLRFHVR